MKPPSLAAALRGPPDRRAGAAALARAKALTLLAGTADAQAPAGEVAPALPDGAAAAAAVVALALVALGALAFRRARRDAAELRASERELRLLFDGAHDAILVFHARDLRVTGANGRAQDLFGRPREALTGTKLPALLEGFPAGRPSELEEDGHLVAELRALRPDGPPVDVEAAVRLVSTNRGLALLRDVAERRRLEAERRALEHRLEETQRLESLGRLAGGVAHDFNNLLMVLGGSAEQARRALPAGSPAEPALDRILTAVERAGDLTRDLLAFAGHGGVRSRPFDLNAAAQELIRLGGESLPAGARIETRLAPDLPPVHGDPSAAQRILLNLLLNAAEALGDVGTRVEVSTRIADADDLARASASGGRGGDGEEPATWVALEVADDGVGMDAETRRRIFDPFYSTRPDGRGLGLATVRGIVASHGGRIAVRSEPGQGTRFTVLLPAGAAPAAEGREEVEPEVEGFRGSGIALVVDDEAGVRQVLRAMLADLGFDVLEADGGRAALEVHAAEGGRIAFTLLDLSMPDLDGVETRRRILARDPDARVILMSGFSEAADRSELGDPFLRKPFLRSDVVRCLRALSR